MKPLLPSSKLPKISEAVYLVEPLPALIVPVTLFAELGWLTIALDALNDQWSKREVVVYSSQPAGYLCSI